MWPATARSPRLALAAALSVTAFGCGSPNARSSAAAAPAASGEVVGPADTHCAGSAPVVVSIAACSGVGPGDDGGAPPFDGDAGAANRYGPPMYNDFGADDACKYTVRFTDSPAVAVGRPMSFDLAIASLADGGPVTGATESQGHGVWVEGFLLDDQTHPLPNTSPSMAATETPAASGTYAISPVVFDASGRWVLRFHIFEICSDRLPDSPHGHASFYFDVP